MLKRNREDYKFKRKYIFHKVQMKKKTAYVLGFLLFFSMLFISLDYAFVFGLIALGIISLILERNKLWAWIPAIAVSGIWMAIAHHFYYGYDSLKLNVFGVALFPILAWPLGLMAGFLMISPLLKMEVWHQRWIAMAVIYVIGLIALETIFYNLLGVKLHYGKSYPGWPLLNCFHIPRWMQLGYFLNGIIFYGITSYVETTRPEMTSNSSSGNTDT